MTEKQKNYYLTRLQNLYEPLSEWYKKETDKKRIQINEFKSKLQKAEKTRLYYEEKINDVQTQKEWELMDKAIKKSTFEENQLKEAIHNNEKEITEYNLESFRNRLMENNKIASLFINLYSPEQIRTKSHGEVNTSETINRRVNRPEYDGLFCEKIFGPINDYECRCGKLKGWGYEGIKCERCGVEVNNSSIRKERIGHIELTTPVVHPWYYRTEPSPIGLLLNISSSDLKSIIFCEKYIVIDPGDTRRYFSPPKKMQILSEFEYQYASFKYDKDFICETGLEAIKTLIEELDLKKIYSDLQTMKKKNGNLEDTLQKKLNIVEYFLENKINPSWMFLEVIPVIPPDMRPQITIYPHHFVSTFNIQYQSVCRRINSLKPDEQPRGIDCFFATSFFNIYYQKIINRNNRIKRLKAMNAPQIIMHNENIMLQKAVDDLFEFYYPIKAKRENGKLDIELSFQDLEQYDDQNIKNSFLFRSDIRHAAIDYFHKNHLDYYCQSKTELKNEEEQIDIIDLCGDIIESIEHYLTIGNSIWLDKNDKMHMSVLTYENKIIILESIEKLKQIIKFYDTKNTDVAKNPSPISSESNEDEKNNTQFSEYLDELKLIARYLAVQNIIDTKTFIKICEPQFVNAPGFRVEGYTGQFGELEAYYICSKCREDVTEEMDYCPNCGANLNSFNDEEEDDDEEEEEEEEEDDEFFDDDDDDYNFFDDDDDDDEDEDD